TLGGPGVRLALAGPRAVDGRPAVHGDLRRHAVLLIVARPAVRAGQEAHRVGGGALPATPQHHQLATSVAPSVSGTHVKYQVIAPSGLVPVVTCSMSPVVTTRPLRAWPFFTSVYSKPAPVLAGSSIDPANPITVPAAVSLVPRSVASLMSLVSPVVGLICSLTVTATVMLVVTTPHSAVISTCPPATVEMVRVAAANAPEGVATGPLPRSSERSWVPWIRVLMVSQSPLRPRSWAGWPASAAASGRGRSRRGCRRPR